MVYYQAVKITIDSLKLAEVIIDIVMKYYCLLELIISDHSFCLPQSSGF